MREHLLTVSSFALVLFFLLLFQVSVLPAFSLTITTIDLLFLLALSVSLLFSYWSGFALALLGGILFDAITLAPGKESIGLILAIVITNVLFLRFFTNKSLWTLLLLGGVGTIILRLTSALLRLSFENLFQTIAVQMLIQSISFVLLFSLIHLLGTRLKPYLLIRKHG